ncbi:hypothetical protein [Lactiplantibacillus plantarum]|uniref:hypothetical protein n=1 Tax=Lactiplantibacillus plantarum TaxID=1590 RepID=UPI000B3E6A62|nr:hypothetical protein [Lactiplantibacillus plantarum]ARW34574.1 hypothetical protein S102022_00570 [Lactiplantibacillus plantarum]
MAVMIHSKYGYEPPEWVRADSQLDKWYKNRKRRAKQHGAFSLDKNKKAAVFRQRSKGY